MTTAIGTAIWIVEVATDGSTRGTRSLPIALVDTALFAVDHGVHTLELGSLANFERRGLEPAVLNLPLPAEEPDDVLGERPDLPAVRLPRRRQRDRLPADARPARRAAGVRGAVRGLHGRARARRHLAVLAAAWGALVGPVWAIALALVNALLQDTLFGHAQGESVFGIVLVFGALVGALGGLPRGRAYAGSPPQAA